MNLVDLKGKTILITGASSGIGREAAILVSQLGGDCALVARRKDDLNKTSSLMTGPSKIYPFDLQKVNGISELVGKIRSEMGPFDGFLHCAGVNKLMALRAITKPLFETVMNVNFYAFLELTKFLTAPNAYRPGMSIVAVSSVSAHHGRSGYTLYSGSKAALEGSVRCLAHELAAKKVRVNSVIPSIIQTPLVRDTISMAAVSDSIKAQLERQYLGIGEPRDVAALMAFLLSDASRFITGASLPVDGGRLSS